MSTHNPQSMFLSRNMKNIRIFLSENFQFLEVKLSIYLNRRVFVMSLFFFFFFFWRGGGCVGGEGRWG